MTAVRDGRVGVAGSTRLLIGAAPAVLVAGALIPRLRPDVAIVLVAGWGILPAARRPEAIAWAAVLPVALVLPWPWLLGADTPLGSAGCTDPASVIAVWRVAVAAFGLAVVAALARAHGSGLTELGLRRPRAPEDANALAALVVVA